ncbi:MAG: DUF6569 family protein [Acidimicrobiales bacterium]
MNMPEIKVEVGKRVEVGGLSVFPITSTQAGELAFLTGPEAFQAGLIEVNELDPPEVPSLAVTNLADVPILLVEGEMLVGGDQNRTMNVTVLCPATSTTIVPVSCVEAGRWGDDSRRVIASSGRHAPGSLRAAKTANLELTLGDGPERPSDQHRVWDEVDRQSRVHEVYSETAALDDIQLELDAFIADQLEKVCPLPDQTGVICTVGATVLGLDLFDRPSTLSHYLRAIVAGHALDAPAMPSGADPLRAIERFLAQVEAATGDAGRGVGRGAVGLGDELHVRGGLVGIGLTYDDALVHLAAYPAPA